MSNEDPEDLLYSNTFTETVVDKDLTDIEKQEFIDYYKQKNTKKRITTKEPEDNIIKIEQTSIVDIDSANRDISAYPDIAEFSVSFGKTFYNVKSVELISSVIPNTDQCIRDTPREIQNNTISWNNEEDNDIGFFIGVDCIQTVGDSKSIDITIPSSNTLSTQQRIGNFYINIMNSNTVPSIDGKRLAELVNSTTLRIPFYEGISSSGTANIDAGVPNYTVTLKPGNYNATTLTEEIQYEMNLVKRRNSTIDTYHFFTVNVSFDTDIITFSSYVTKQMIANPISTISGTGIISVFSSDHGFYTGDKVLMIGLVTTAGLDANILNGLFTVNVTGSDSFTYEVNRNANESANGGGSTVRTGTPDNFRLLFNTAKSLIVNNTGFPNEDSSSFIGINDALSTTVLSINSSTYSGNYITITSNSHGLIGNDSYPIATISDDTFPVVTCSIPHNLKNKETVYLEYTPLDLDGFYSIKVLGNYSFHLNTVKNNIPRGIGFVNDVPILSIGTGLSPLVTTVYPHNLVSGVALVISNTSTPNLNGNYSIIVVNATTFNLNTVTITASPSSVGNLKHGGDSILLYNFKSIPVISKNIQIVENVTNNTFQIASNLLSIETNDNATIGTQIVRVNHPSHGFNRITNISNGVGGVLIVTLVPHGLSGTKYLGISASTVIASTVDLIINSHGLTTSDKILVTNSTTNPFINGTYPIQTIDQNTIRITVIGGVTSPGTCSVNVGDKIVITESNSIPDITINTFNTANYYINKISNVSFEIDTGFSISTPGTYGLIGRSNSFALNRAIGNRLNSKDLGGVSLTDINSAHDVGGIIDENTYFFRANSYATENVSGGGDNIVISSQTKGYRYFQCNTFTGEATGVLYRSISLEGENYIFLIIPSMHTIFSQGDENIGDIFAKILLNQPPGIMMFDSYVSTPKIFNPPLGVLNELQIKMTRRDGYLFNFNKTNYAISLKITEILNKITGTGVSERTGKSGYY